jgi:hypothetical protein
MNVLAPSSGLKSNSIGFTLNPEDGGSTFLQKTISNFIHTLWSHIPENNNYSSVHTCLFVVFSLKRGVRKCPMF